MTEINYKKVIEDRYKHKVQIKVEFGKILSKLFILLLINVIFLYIGYNNYQFENIILYKINNYLYWILFFNNILINLTIFNLLLTIKDSFLIKKYTGEKKKLFNEDGTLNLKTRT